MRGRNAFDDNCTEECFCRYTLHSIHRIAFLQLWSNQVQRTLITVFGEKDTHNVISQRRRVIASPIIVELLSRCCTFSKHEVVLATNGELASVPFEHKLKCSKTLFGAF